MLIATVLLIQYFALRIYFHRPYFEISENDFIAILEFDLAVSMTSAIALFCIARAFQAHRHTTRIVLLSVGISLSLISLFAITALWWGVEYTFGREGYATCAFVFVSGALSALLIYRILRVVFRALAK